MCLVDQKPRLKISDTFEKATLPGAKKILRYTDEKGLFQADAIALEEENHIQRIHASFGREKPRSLSGLKAELLHETAMREGIRTAPRTNLDDIAQYAQRRLAQLPEAHRRFEHPAPYVVGISETLMALRGRVV